MTKEVIQNQREKLVYRIITGNQFVVVGNTRYKISPPTAEQKMIASEIYEATIEKNRFGSWLTDAACLRLLVKNGLCSADIDNNLKIIDKEVEDLKVKLYTSLFNKEEHQKIKTRLELVKNKQKEMLVIRNSMNHLTLEGYAEMIKQQFLIANNIRYYCTNELLWEKEEDVDAFLFENILSEISMNSPTIAQIRDLARNEPWRNYWNIKKPVFNSAPGEFTEEQKSIVLFSKMYDSAYEHPNCPPDNVIHNDDLFDGWMISERRNNEKAKMDKEIDKKLSRSGKMEKADEIFILAKNKDEINEINNMNDTQSKIIKAQRQAVIKQRGTAVDANFPDRKVELQENINTKFKETVKGR